MTAKPSSGGIDDHPMAEINVTPFTDVLLVLLIIFMLLSAIATPAGFQKSFSGSPTPTQGVHQKPGIFVAIQGGPRFAIDGRTYPRAQLGAALARAIAWRRRHSARYSTHISIEAPKSVTYQSIMDVLDAARSDGDEDVGFVVSGR